jgi:murein DD-endopeptidase MepM/ murein hydrolase activator NlpD
MELQFHPKSGRGAVRTYSVGPGGERTLLALACVLALLALSLLWTVPVTLARMRRHEARSDIAREAESARLAAREAEAALLLTKEHALDLGDRLNRIAFLYEIPAAVWPGPLDPGRGVIEGNPDRIVRGLERYAAALERGRALIEERERADPELPRRTPSLLPLAAGQFEPSALFGPRISPWTGEQEFFPGVQLSASEGSAVIAPAGGTVVFVGKARPVPRGWLWRLGNVVVLSHGLSGATVYGHLSRVDVRKGQRLERHDRIGAVGRTGWAMAPQLHYEVWRFEGTRLRPTDALFAVLDHDLERERVSLERMAATSLPEPVERLPGY